MKRRAVIALIGGLSFWGPPILVNILTHRELRLAVGSLLPPGSLIGCFFLLRWKCLNWTRSISLWMLLGIYLFGSWFMCIGFTALGGGLHELHGWHDVIILLVFGPFFTVDLSFSHVTGLGLVASTIILPLINVTIERRSVIREN